jgi:hypothetical protein
MAQVGLWSVLGFYLPMLAVVLFREAKRVPIPNMDDPGKMRATVSQFFTSAGRSSS